MPMKNHFELVHEMQVFVNKHGIDAELGVPDFLVAAFLMYVLTDLQTLLTQKAVWESTGGQPTGGEP